MGSDDKVFSRDPPFDRFFQLCVDFFEKPVIWFRENIVLPNRKEYYWYHEKLRRVPSIDQCYTDDIVCVYEADEQYKRDKEVEKFILQILRKRFEYCVGDNKHYEETCAPLKETYDRAVDNYFIKYGDMGFKGNALTCLMKQKNRMAFERRHGPIGSGRKSEEEVLRRRKTQTCS